MNYTNIIYELLLIKFPNICNLIEYPSSLYSKDQYILIIYNILI